MKYLLLISEAMHDIVNASYQELPRTPPKPIIKSPGNRRKQHSPLRFSQNASFSRIEDLSSIVKPPTGLYLSISLLLILNTDCEMENSNKSTVLLLEFSVMLDSLSCSFTSILSLTNCLQHV